MHTQNFKENFEAEGTLLHPSSRKFFRHWESTRGARACPNRADFRFEPIQDLMPNMFVLDRDHLKSTYNYRLAGTAVCEIFRKELTGTNALQGWDKFEHGILEKSLAVATTALQPSVVRMRLQSDRQHVIGVEVVSLPVESRFSAKIDIVGAMFAFTETRSLEYFAIKHRELVSNRMIWTEHVTSEQMTDIGNGTGQPTFRVIKGGRA